jgi:hypothetical protein
MKRKLQCKRPEKLITTTPMKKTKINIKDSRKTAPAIATSKCASHVQQETREIKVEQSVKF